MASEKTKLKQIKFYLQIDFKHKEKGQPDFSS